MNSISMLVLALLTVRALSHPADESISLSKTKSKSTERNVELDTDVKVEAEKKTTTNAFANANTNTRTMSHPTVKCEHIYLGKGKGKDVEIEERRDENHACFSHCVTLGSEYREGKCDGGLCHCEREVSLRGNSGRVPTVKCTDLVVVAAEGETIKDNGEACELHCNTLGDRLQEGKCERGVCTCRVS